MSEYNKVTVDKLMESIPCGSSKLQSAQVGGTLYVFVEETKDKVWKRMTREAIRTGHAIRHKEGREFFEWVERWENQNYVWHKDGNRVKMDLVRRMFDKDGNETRKIVKTVYRKMEDA
jgi:hypothetical protein